MPTEWFYQQGGQTIGPLSPKELLAKVREGEVLPQTLVKKDDSQWVEASAVGGLAEAATKDRIYQCPYCGGAINRPPATCSHCTRWVDYTEDFIDPAKKQIEQEKRTPEVIKRVATWVRALMDDDKSAD